jgi:SAM-dependent methyltransferase
MDEGAGKPTALDVGCGPGLVMELFSRSLDVKGIDKNPDMVGRAKARSMDAVLGDVSALPFENGSFDIAYCSFTMLWVKDPQKAIEEMTRVSSKFVVCLAEPDYGGRFCHPKEVADLDRHLVDSLREEGADPFIGRKVGQMMEKAGLEVEIGTHPGAWSPEQLRSEAKDEWDSIFSAVKERASPVEIERARSAWGRSLADGSLFLFNPVFYAIGRKA